MALLSLIFSTVANSCSVIIHQYVFTEPLSYYFSNNWVHKDWLWAESLAKYFTYFSLHGSKWLDAALLQYSVYTVIAVWFIYVYMGSTSKSDGYNHMDTLNLATHAIEMPCHGKYQGFPKTNLPKCLMILSHLFYNWSALVYRHMYLS